MFLHSSCLSSAFRCFLHPHEAAISFRQLRFLSQSVVNMRQSLQTHYEVLGLSPSASQTEIRSAFLRLSKQIHPDLNPADPSNHIKFVRLNEAYSVLSNISSRREYDLRLQHWKRVAETAQSYAQSHYRATGQQRDWQNTYRYETEHEIRSRVRNAAAASQSDDDAYYGIKGIPRQSNGVVAGACCLLLLLGCLYFYFGYKYALKQIEMSLVVDRENRRILREIQERAQTLSHDEQLQQLIKHREASRTRIDATKPQQ